MTFSLLSFTKYALTRVGALLPARVLVQLHAAMNYMRLGRELREHGYDFPQRLATREDVWQEVLSRVRGEQVLYLEFGVAYGDSMRYWSRELLHPETKLHGFDSFEGLPESSGPWKKGQFGSGGTLPAIGDSRVEFFQGWFEQTLPAYKLPKHDVLVVNMDADLYSSTIYVLRMLKDSINSGTYIYFDELNHVEHEWKAFVEFQSETGLVFQPVAADRSLAFAVFKCVGAASSGH